MTLIAEGKLSSSGANKVLSFIVSTEHADAQRASVFAALSR